MGKTRLKTTRWGFETRITTLATDTTLAASTRHDFPASTFYIPEGTRTIKDAFAVFSFTCGGAAGVAVSVSAVRLGMKIGAAAFVDVDTTFNQPHTGEAETVFHALGFTANMVTNLGGGSSVAIQPSVTVSTSAAATVTACTCEVFVTYEYDDGAGTQIKTIVIPFQSDITDLGVAFSEPGAVGTGACPANQIPQLTGVGGFIDEASPVIRDQYIVVSATSYGSPAVTAFNMDVRLDGATTLSRSTYDAALQTSVKVHDIIHQALMASVGAAHAFELKSSLADRFWPTGGWMVVTYEYDEATTTKVTNSQYVGMENGKAELPASNLDTTTNQAQLRCRLNVQEPGTITLKQSAVIVHQHTQGATTQTILATGQTGRPYLGIVSQICESDKCIVHRTDHSSSDWITDLTTRGIVELKCILRNSNSGGAPLPTAAIINYSSDKSPQGTGAHNHTVWYLNKQYEGTIIVLGRVTPTPPSIPEAEYLISAVAMLAAVRQQASYMGLRADRLTGEEDGGGQTFSMNGIGALSAEVGSKWIPFPITSWFRQANYQATAFYGCDVQASRGWTYDSQGATASYMGLLALTYSANAFDVAGTVTNNGIAISGGTVEIYAKAIDGKAPGAELIGTATTNGAGAFSFSTTDNTRDYFASYTNGAAIHGRSKIGKPTTDTFDITMASGGGGGSITAPTISNVTPSEGSSPGSPGQFSMTFAVARLTPIEFDIDDIFPGADITISVKYDNRNETYTALRSGQAGVFEWPFDVPSDNSIGAIGAPPVHVSLLPRGGWPPTTVRVTVAAAKKATGLTP